MMFLIIALQSFNLKEMHHNTAEITDNWSLLGAVLQA